ncbi:MAG: magnesium transporter [Treponema sp.]|jgi:magnesium transporter|nr:magnesium transporter [Treponema sp.]
MDKEEIIGLIKNGPLKVGELKTMLSEMNVPDIAELFEELDKEKSIQIFRILPKAIASEVFSHMESDRQQTIIEALTDSEIGEIMNELFVDDAVYFIEEMPANVVRRALKSVQGEKRKHINQILNYPEKSAGSIMTTELVALREDATVQEAFKTIRGTGLNKETIYTCYVIKRDRQLVGVITAKKLMLARPEDRIGDIMETNVVFAHTTDDQEAVADQFQKYDFLAMPVVDNEQMLVGIITVDDIVDVIVEESTEDIEKMGALAPSDEPYMKTGILRLAKNRFLWLLVLMLSATITANIIEGFEESLALMPILMAFIPMLMDTGGNSGAQASTLIIRGMALGDIRLRDFLRVFWKEIRVALLCAVALSAVNFGRIYLMHGQNMLLAITVSLTLICTVVVAKSLGGLLPMLAKRLKIDPAMMAAPVITSIADATSLVIYFSIARVILGL